MENDTKHCSQLHKNLPIDNTIKINNNVKSIATTTCKKYILVFINSEKHTPISVKKWSEQYPNFNNAEPHIWKRIFKMSFITVRDTKIQTLQCKIIHNIISCNQWLHNIKIKENNKCAFCKDIDNLPHVFLKCDKVKQFWSHWFNWWQKISGFEIQLDNNVIEGCILFGFPHKSDIIMVLNYCILYSKYYIYI